MGRLDRGRLSLIVLWNFLPQEVVVKAPDGIDIFQRVEQTEVLDGKAGQEPPGSDWFVELLATGGGGCCDDCSVYIPCTRRCICVTAIALLLLGVIAAIIALVVTVGLPPHTPVNRICVTTSNQTGFLCDDRETCLPASKVCDTRRDCINGEDEQKTLCSDIPNSLPGYLIFYCGNGRFWIYADKRCNGFNDCGDCSDELGSKASCPPCRPEQWRCTSVFHKYCDCIPRILCQDGIQDCNDWSDEYICKR
ncbi:low-density lipoprotein receptor class A domain-containing protein 1 [Tiliqua scincoides]|uniref:low-density lipoprotein receptor class A domain-containing protein 1 n=1 Tax=Tiliqua scincoides TaxID=71010 RepID=UPI00346356BD